MADENDHADSPELESRAPTLVDVRELCRELNKRDARYIVIGGFAMMALGFNRQTMDVDLLIDITGDNESRVLDATATLPDGAARQVKPGEVSQHNVVRIADEIVVDLMRSACAIDYAEALPMATILAVDGVNIPFASPELLWLTKKPTHREKDVPDLIFLRDWFQRRNLEPPKT